MRGLGVGMGAKVGLGGLGGDVIEYGDRVCDEG